MYVSICACVLYPPHKQYTICENRVRERLEKLSEQHKSAMNDFVRQNKEEKMT